jgi:hypothetical protein
VSGKSGRATSTCERHQTGSREAYRQRFNGSDIVDRSLRSLHHEIERYEIELSEPPALAEIGIAFSRPHDIVVERFRQGIGEILGIDDFRPFGLPYITSARPTCPGGGRCSDTGGGRGGRQHDGDALRGDFQVDRLWPCLTRLLHGDEELAARIPDNLLIVVCRLPMRRLDVVVFLGALLRDRPARGYDDFVLAGQFFEKPTSRPSTGSVISSPFSGDRER